MSWEAASFVVLALLLAAGFASYERHKPPARVLALVATLAALAVVGRLAFAAIPNVKPTTDIVLFAGYALGGLPGFAVGAITALVSNVFLSQGPWTPWQMVGWGTVGLGGAALARALHGREPNRLLLAAVCGLAGLAFGAWMDLYQLTLAARQDIDTYLALSASSLPYNLAHAIGNVVFCLLIGPVFIRALRRYRRRLEIRWAAPVAAGAALALLMLHPAAAGGATPSERAERYLLRAQNADGGFGASPGQASGQLYSGWSGLGLAAAGNNARDVHRRGGRSLVRYLERSAGSLKDVGEIERTILLIETAGLSARGFAGKDRVAAVTARRRADGSIAGYVSYTAFGVLALHAAGVSAGSSTVAWLVSAQNSDGGFGVAPASASDSDMTGAALQALSAVGRKRARPVKRAVTWLRANQNDDGGFGQFKGRSSNAQSTAYAVQGLVAAGAGGATLTRALAYLRGLQRRDGSVAYSSTSAQTPVWVTAQALMALERKPLPLAAVPRRKRRSRGSTPEQDEAAPPARETPGGSGGAPPPKADPPEPAGDARAADGLGAAAGAKREAARPDEPTVSTPGLRSDSPERKDEGESVSAWIVAAGVAGTLGLLALFRRRLLPGRVKRMWRQRRMA